jgi:hypothetical protein
MTRPTGRPMGRPRVHHVRRLVDHPAPTPQSTPCRLWQGATSGNSYGTLRVGQDKVYVHRWVWEQANGPIPPGMQIMHHCDQPLCYRLDHLALGTRSDNMMDMSRKGRGRQIMQRTECGKGHPLEQLGQCITCKREVQKLAARRKRARARAAQLSTVALLAVALLMIPGHGIAGDSLSRGDTGPRVAEVQSILASMQYSVTVDGVYGKQTERAVRSWQRSNGLVVDGIVGASTLQSLRSATRINNAHTVGAPADPGPVPVRSVEQIIRDVWPDDLEDRALTIATRESRLIPTARNYCCHGLFQLYWSIHRGWLAEHGVTSVEQLYDPETNARMALVLFQRAGGWGPWSQTNY